jgi:uroporphyrinogen III methyltransferase/synthase
MTTGFVSLVGAGPGDPGLLTLAGRDRLAAADVVVYDRLLNPALLDHAPPTAERVFAGKSPERKAMTQDEINDFLVQQGKAGKRVVRLKGGDPFVFGRGGEEALALAAAGVPFEVIPGVTSAIAAPAYAGVPVTHRGLASSFAVVTGHEDDEKEEQSVDWSRLATAVDTIVVLMGGAALPSVAANLIKGGRAQDTPAVSVEWGTTTAQRSVSAPLSDIAQTVRDARLGTPLLTVVGKVADLREHLAWFESRPLFGKRVLVTRTRQQSSALAELLRRQGAVPVELPTLELVGVKENDDILWAIENLVFGRYSFCIFTSANTVDHLWQHLQANDKDARIFADCRVAAIGQATSAELLAHGIRPDLVPPEATSEGLLSEISHWGIEKTRILLPLAAETRGVLAHGLRAYEAEVDEVVLYESRPPPEVDPDALQVIRDGRIDIATFASSSSVKNLAQLLGPDFDRIKTATIASIGPVTSQTAREHGLAVDVEPAEHTIPALVEALAQHFAQRRFDTRSSTSSGRTS